MKSSAKLNEKLDSVLEGKPPVVAPSSPNRPCLFHAGRCECADCKLIFDRRPKYFNANVARHVECRERLKRVLKRRRAEKEEEIYSENGSSYYESEESECEVSLGRNTNFCEICPLLIQSEESKVGNQVDERTVEELVEYVQGTSGQKDAKKANASKTKKKTPRRQLKIERQNSEEIQKEDEHLDQETLGEDGCAAKIQSVCEVKNQSSAVKNEALGVEKPMCNKRARNNSSPSPVESKTISANNDELGKAKEEAVKKMRERKKKSASTINIEPVKSESEKMLSSKSKEMVAEDKLSESTQHESSVETSRRSEWAVVSYPKKPCRNSAVQVSKTAVNNNERAKKKSKLQKTKSSATIVSDMSMATSLGTTAYLGGSSMCSFSNADYSGPVLPTIVLKKSRNCEKDPNLCSAPRAKPTTSQNPPIPSLLDLNFKLPVAPVSCDAIRLCDNIQDVQQTQNHPPAPPVVCRTVLQDISNQLHERMEHMRLGNKFGAIGEERKTRCLKKKGAISSVVKLIDHPLGGLMDSGLDEYVPAVCINHRGYRIGELDSSKYSCVEEQRGLPCKFGAIGEERKKKAAKKNADDALCQSTRSEYVFQL